MILLLVNFFSIPIFDLGTLRRGLKNGWAVQMLKAMVFLRQNSKYRPSVDEVVQEYFRRLKAC